jgi:hypothetical protein
VSRLEIQDVERYVSLQKLTLSGGEDNVKHLARQSFFNDFQAQITRISGGFA